MTVSLTSANDYHSQRLSKELWEAETTDRRNRALVAASDLLRPYLLRLPVRTGEYADGAVYEQALYMMGSEYENAVNGVTSVGLKGISMSWQREKSPPKGIAPRAWGLLQEAMGAAGGGFIRGGAIR